MKRLLLALALVLAMAGWGWTIGDDYKRPKGNLGGGLGIGVGGGGVSYYLNDTFTTADAAPITTPRTAEPSPGVAAIRDVENKIAIASSWLEWTAQATAAYADQDIVYTTPAITRTVGRILTAKYRLATDELHYPLALVSSTTPAWNHTNVDAGFWRSAALTLSSVNNATVGPRIADVVADGTIYNLGIIQKAAGDFSLIKGGTYGTSWKLLRISTTGNAATLYAASAGNLAVFSTDIYRVPNFLWTPKPISADSFGGTWPTTNGGGLTGLEAGGNGLTWTPSATWSIAAGAAVNAPVAGLDAITNGTFDTDANWNKGANWTIDTGDSNVAEKAGGIASSLSQTSVLTDNIWFRAEMDVIRTAGGFWVQFGSTGILGHTKVLSGAYVSTGRADGNVYAIISGNTASAGTIDNVSFQPLVTSELITSINHTSSPDCYMSVKPTIATGFQAGIAFNIDDPANPQTYNLVYYNQNDGKIYWDKCVAGTYTNHSATTAVYSAGTPLVVRKIGTSIYIWYNNAYVTSGTATVTTGNYHGMFQTGNGATETKLDDWFCYGSGTNNEYSLLDLFVN